MINNALKDPILQQAEQQVESQLLPDTKDAYLRIVVTGMKAAMAGGPNSMIAKLRNSKDPMGDAARGAVSLVILMSHQSKGVMPPKAIPPAAATLMFQALDFLEKAGVVKITEDNLAAATHLQANVILAKFKVTPQMMHSAAANVHRVLQDPTAMEKINRKAGVVKAPGTSTPTDVSPETEAAS